jgi:hypothetical protein
MMWRWRYVVMVLGSVCLFAAGDEKTITVRPEPSDAVLLNPGKGWVLYGLPGDQSDQMLKLGTVGYYRFSWADIEPEEGRFNWRLVDHCTTAWVEKGKQFAFGVMCANSHSPVPYVTPKWVFDAGAKFRQVTVKPQDPSYGTAGDKIVPSFDDPVFLEKLRVFVSALAKRYDGDSRLAFIDIRSYGNWGEGHLHPFGGNPISKEMLRAHIQMHRDAFKRTVLVLPYGGAAYEDVYDWAVAQGIGMRRDGICGNSNGRETARCLGKTPAVFEFYGSYEYPKERGWWDGKTQWGHGYRLVDCVGRGHPSYISMSQWGNNAQTFLAAERPLIEKLANEMGYHFVLREAQYPSKLRQGRTGVIGLHWENRGVAPAYVPCVVGMGLLSDDGTPADVCWPVQCNPAAWLPGEIKEAAAVSFDKARPGRFRLAVALFHHVGDEQPAFRLGIDSPPVNGWYVLGSIQIEER